MVPLALLLIFLLLLTSFGSMRAGAARLHRRAARAHRRDLALAVRGIPFSITAGVGFIALSGVAVLNGVVMLSFIAKLRAEGVALDDADPARGARPGSVRCS